MNQPVELKVPLTQTQNLAATMAGEALVMMVDDEELVIELIQAYLDGAGYGRFISTTEPRDALELMLRERPQVVLLDLNMPGVSGFDILEAMRTEPSLRHIPVIVLTAVNDPETKLKALGLGASDFLGKPVDESELVLRLRNTLAAKAYQDYLAYYDRVTGLANRHRFMSELDRAVRDAYAEGRMGAALLFDLDRFNQINEALGPASGDHVIREAGSRIRGVMQGLVRAEETPVQQPLGARFGGDEFSVLLPSVANVEQASRAVESVLRALAAPYQADGKELHVTASAGIALFPADGVVIDEVIRSAEAALRQAKEAGRNGYRFYSKEFNDKAAHRLSLENQLRKAIERGEPGMFVLEREGRALGWLWVTFNTNFLTDERYATFRSLAVDDAAPDHAALAEALFNYGIAYAQQAGMLEITGKVHVNNTRMRLLYKKAGFEAEHLTMKLPLTDA